MTVNYFWQVVSICWLSVAQYINYGLIAIKSLSYNNRLIKLSLDLDKGAVPECTLISSNFFMIERAFSTQPFSESRSANAQIFFFVNLMQ